MAKLYQYLVGLLIIFMFLSPVKSTAQEDAILLVISNQEAKILIDGVEKGTVKANAAVRIITTIREHYVEAERLGAWISY